MMKIFLYCFCFFTLSISAQENGDSLHPERNQRHIFKVDPVQQSNGEIIVAYEQQIIKILSFEIEGGATVSSFNYADWQLYGAEPKRESRIGMTGSFALRYYLVGNKQEHLGGFYLSPKIKYRHDNESLEYFPNYVDPVALKGYSKELSVSLNAGIQHWISSRYSIDLYLGLGFANVNELTYTLENKPNDIGYLWVKQVSHTQPLILNYGLKLGIGSRNTYRVPSPDEEIKLRLANHKNAFKIDPFQALAGELNFAYERLIQRQSTVEIEAGPTFYDYLHKENVPWAGDYASRKSKFGYFASAALRLYILENRPGINQLYLSPKFKYRRYNEIVRNSTENKKGYRNESFLTLNMGYQHWFGKFSMDLYAGCGIANYDLLTWFKAYASPWYRNSSQKTEFVGTIGLKLGIGY